MNITARAGLAALMTCMAAAVAATPAVAGESVPVGVPLDGLEIPLGTELPEVGTGVPVLMPGVPDGPTYHTGELVPNPVLPAVPLTAGLPPLLAQGALPDVLAHGPEGDAELTAPASDLVTRSPGVVLGAPLSAPRPQNMGLPDLVMPKLGVLTPALQGAPDAFLGLS
ncbi:hypothetical protein [Streptomyces sp. NPDC006879]|uniref:hypothetical protein n=1 Tax=Streptomyces sp. NPDC006879 TaxID=3364767 RepID=UPI0036BE1479